MKYWVLKDNSDPNKYAVTGATIKPINAICEAPEGATTTDGKYITVETITNELGNEIKVASLDSEQKAADEQAAADAKAAVQYKEDRRKAYPSIGDQLDAIYKKLELNDSTDWDAIAAQIAQVKTDYPKPE